MPRDGERFPPWLPHVAPYGLFLLLTAGVGLLPGSGLLLYPVRLVLVAGAVYLFWRAGRYPELDLRPSLLGMAAGLAGFLLWALPEDLLGFLPKLGRSTFDPRAAGDAWFAPVLAVRITEAVLLVPVFEELFLRSFLLRYADVIDTPGSDFREVPLGRYRLFSFLVVVAMMAVTHHRWLRAALYSALLNLVLYREKRMGGVIWAHAVTNLALWIFAVRTGGWSFW